MVVGDEVDVQMGKKLAGMKFKSPFILGRSPNLAPL